MKPQKEQLSDASANNSASGANAFLLGAAHIKPALNRIEIGGVEHQLEPKVMQVLLQLSARPGHVVLRDELLRLVWGQVADDYLLNRAISELRKIFCDKASEPDYIETIRKTGYRLLAPIKPVASAALVPATNAKMASSLASELDELPQQAARASRMKSPWLVLLLALIAAIGGFAVSQLIPEKEALPLAGYQIYPLTSRLGREYDAALSPDGSRIVYVADNAEGGNALFVKMISGEKALQLSPDGSYLRSPQWMPDGQSIVYAELNQGRLQIKNVSPLGGASRVLFSMQAESVRGIAVSPDGQQLAFSARAAASQVLRIWLLSLATGHAEQITQAQPGLLGDIDPLFSPDGSILYFVRGRDEVTKDIYAKQLSSAELTRLTFDNRKVNGISWSADGSKLLFTSTRSGLYRLWWIDKQGSEPQPLALGMETVQRPTSAVGVEALVFEDWKHRATLVSVGLNKGRNTQLQPLLNSTRWDSSPSIAADGSRLVFASDRGGAYSLWLSDLAGTEAYQWLSLEGAFIDNPTWSPDGRHVAFDASPDGEAQIFLMNESSTAPQRLDLGAGNSRSPAWSRDGEWIYFESNRQGIWQIFAYKLATNQLQVVNLPEGRGPQASADGEWLLYASDSGTEIRRCAIASCLQGSAEAEQETLILNLHARDATNWTAAKNGVYFIRRNKAEAFIALYDYESAEEKKIAELPSTFYGWGMVIMPDESALVFTMPEQHESDIRIARP